MPNSIDFQVGSKFMELAGGVEVNNLQEAIKKALQEITLPICRLPPPMRHPHLQTCRGWPRPRREGSRSKRWPR